MVSLAIQYAPEQPQPVLSNVSPRQSTECCPHEAAATGPDTIMALLTGKETEGLGGHSEEGEGPALLY